MSFTFARFASLAHPEKFGYAFDTTAWSRAGSTSETHNYFRQYETYGDGLTQHSGDWSVTFDYLTDYLASLAVAMMANNELASAAAYTIRHDARESAIAFAASVVYRESDKNYDKRRFFSVDLEKIGSRTKQHDRRYTEIRDWHDGSRSSIYRLCLSEYSSRFEAFKIAEAVKVWCDRQSKYVPLGDSFPEFFGGDSQQVIRLRQALECCKHIVEAVERREWAQCAIDNYTARLAREAERLAARSVETEVSDVA